MELFGIDLTLPLFVLGSFAGLCVLEYLLCRKAKRKWIKMLPWGVVVWNLGLSVIVLLGDSGGFLDLRNFFATVFAVYAAICGAGIVLGWHLAKKEKK